MPVKRRLSKGRAQLTAGQLLFLRGEPWPAEDAAYGHDGDPGARYWQVMRHCWLTQPHRSGGMPDGSATAMELWAAYGAEVMSTWPKGGPPHPALLRFGPPVVHED